LPKENAKKKRKMPKKSKKHQAMPINNIQYFQEDLLTHISLYQ